MLCFALFYFPSQMKLTLDRVAPGYKGTTNVVAPRSRYHWVQSNKYILRTGFFYSEQNWTESELHLEKNALNLIKFDESKTFSFRKTFRMFRGTYRLYDIISDIRHHQIYGSLNRNTLLKDKLELFNKNQEIINMVRWTVIPLWNDVV